MAKVKPQVTLLRFKRTTGGIHWAAKLMKEKNLQTGDQVAIVKALRLAYAEGYKDGIEDSN